MMLTGLRRSLNWYLILLSGLCTLVLGIWGWTVFFASTAECYTGAGISFRGFLDNWGEVIYRTLILFLGQTTENKICDSNWPLRYAHFTALGTLFGGAIRLSIEFCCSGIERWLIGRKRGHVVVCGLGERGRAFAEDRVDDDCSVVAIEIAANEEIHTFCQAKGIYLVVGDCRDRVVLERAAVERAGSLIVVTGNDSDNLTVACRAREIVAGSDKNCEPLIARVSINHPPLWREMIESDLIDRSDERFVFEPFSLPALAARALLWEEPIYSFAYLMGQQRVHAVVFGFDTYAENLIAQIGRVCVFRNFANPLVTVLDADQDAASKTLLQHLPEIREVLDINVDEFDPRSDSLEPFNIQQIASEAPVTAIFVCLENDTIGLRTALYIQRAMQRSGCPEAPIFVRLNQRDAIAGTLRAPQTVTRFGDIVSAFGVSSEMCQMNFIAGDLEQHAKDIHDDYLRTRKVSEGEKRDPVRAESAQCWRHLRETYREANRRAADHIKAKLASVGAWQPPGTSLRSYSEFSYPVAENEICALAELEHRSWCAGAFLDGWKRADRRDNRRKKHNNLVSFKDLDGPTKKYDSDQIIGVFNRLKRRSCNSETAPDLIRNDVWIGFIGRNHVSIGEDDWVAKIIEENLLPGILERHVGHFFTLVTPLAPGLDFTMTRVALKVLRERNVPHRLLVPEGVPAQQLVEDFLVDEAAVNAGRWGATVAGDPTASSALIAKNILSGREDMVTAERRDWFIDLTNGEYDFDGGTARSEQGYVRSNEYLVEKCPILVVATGKNAARKPGGSIDALESRRAYVDPPGHWPIQPPRECAFLDLNSRTLTWETGDGSGG